MQKTLDTDEKMLEFLKRLASLPGLSGYEAPVRQVIEETWHPLVDETSLSAVGSLHALRRGTLPEPRPSLLIAAHMDAIGLMVKSVVDGFIQVTSVGGVDVRVLPGQLVTVHGMRELPGVVVQPPAHVLPEDQRDDRASTETLLVDVGLEPRQVTRQVRIGDLVSFAQPPIEMSAEYFVGHSLDNRASVTALTRALQLLAGRQIEWDLWMVATVQEEEGLVGAFTSAYHLRPSLAIAVDVTFGAGPGSPAHKTYPMGKGLTLGWGPNIHPRLHHVFAELADQLEIPWKIEVMPRHSGTDAVGLQVAAQGVPTMVVSIPLRYMHTPVEMVSIKDINRAGRLLAEFVTQLDEEFMDKLGWDKHNEA